jgi:hypothetical protein
VNPKSRFFNVLSQQKDDNSSPSAGYSWYNRQNKAGKPINIRECGFVSPPVVTAITAEGQRYDCPAITTFYTKTQLFYVKTVANARAADMTRGECDVNWIATGYNC